MDTKQQLIYSWFWENKNLILAQCQIEAIIEAFEHPKEYNTFKELAIEINSWTSVMLGIGQVRILDSKLCQI